MTTEYEKAVKDFVENMMDYAPKKSLGQWAFDHKTAIIKALLIADAAKCRGLEKQDNNKMEEKK